MDIKPLTPRLSVSPQRLPQDMQEIARAGFRSGLAAAASNVLAALDGKAPVAAYDGYGSCPLTVVAGQPS